MSAIFTSSIRTVGNFFISDVPQFTQHTVKMIEGLRPLQLIANTTARTFCAALGAGIATVGTVFVAAWTIKQITQAALSAMGYQIVPTTEMKANSANPDAATKKLESALKVFDVMTKNLSEDEKRELKQQCNEQRENSDQVKSEISFCVVSKAYLENQKLEIEQLQKQPDLAKESSKEAEDPKNRLQTLSASERRLLDTSRELSLTVGKLKFQISESEKQTKEIQAKLDKKHIELQELTAKIQEKETTIESLKTEFEDTKTKLRAEFQTSGEELTQNIIKAKSELDQQIAAKQELEKQIQFANYDLSIQTAEIEEKTTAICVLEEKISAKSSELLKLQEKNSTLTSELGEAQKALREAEGNVESIRKELKQTTEQLQRNSAEKETFEVEIKKLNSAILLKEDTISTLPQHIENATAPLQKKYDALVKKSAKLYQENRQLKDVLTTAESLTKQLEQSNKELLEQKALIANTTQQRDDSNLKLACSKQKIKKLNLEITQLQQLNKELAQKGKIELVGEEEKINEISESSSTDRSETPSPEPMATEDVKNPSDPIKTEASETNQPSEVEVA